MQDASVRQCVMYLLLLQNTAKEKFLKSGIRGHTSHCHTKMTCLGAKKLISSTDFKITVLNKYNKQK